MHLLVIRATVETGTDQCSIGSTKQHGCPASTMDTIPADHLPTMRDLHIPEQSGTLAVCVQAKVTEAGGRSRGWYMARLFTKAESFPCRLPARRRGPQSIESQLEIEQGSVVRRFRLAVVIKD
ncbi:hypothetical protein cyc_05283 [Cyclospora cayetanensis]|uniref:Uncharacterized protein n=1 Tax=Cyclospora cayetanensis TaxID=88456 RepID=A0A1D3D1B1_9EIME|nr:hypothetical protein cyc_05283 [Cyclospora cayetanensis]